MAEVERSWFCYMLRCGDGSFYVGAAKDPGARVERHNTGFGARHTASRRPVRLVWWEEFASELLARGREAELKGWRREKKLALIAGFEKIYPSPLRCGLRINFQASGLKI